VITTLSLLYLTKTINTMTDKQLKELNKNFKRTKVQKDFKKLLKSYDKIPLFNQVQFVSSIKDDE